MLALRNFFPKIGYENKRTIFVGAFCSGKMFETIEQLTGIAKKEWEAIEAGTADPFDLKKIVKRGPSTYDSPTLIPSAFHGRLVGCVCHPYQRYVCWMWLEKDSPKRCECGHWFKIKEIQPFYSPPQSC